MSVRRQPGEIVKRQAGSGFIGSNEPEFIQVPEVPEYNEEADPCMMGCGDTHCREWANLRIAHGLYKGEFIYHIAECEMMSPSPQELNLLD